MSDLFKRILGRFRKKKEPEKMLNAREKMERIHAKMTELVDLVEPQFRDRSHTTRQTLAVSLSKAVLIMLEDKYVYGGKNPHIIKGRKFNA